MSLTNQDISQPSLCHLSLGSSMVRASHRRSEGPAGSIPVWGSEIFSGFAKD